ncbi:hypothetical protein DL764_005890 [Monosporascus ibericus]|uniref:Phosphatidic acid phosphatase type 2/haloperoxidase domain-containing protein n=1 Tax=Monosporascus ibericus TaxID=155417 RepID=A0A4Q4T7D2_9PEZI|nr:hypothetical protein DL764_005890 [Monosporascus ibericus]
MGLFRKQPGAGNASNGHSKATRRHERTPETYTMSTRPSFGQWLKHTWFDIVMMACMGALGLGIYMARPAANRSFAVTFADGEIVYPEFAYPLRKEIIPIWLAAFLASVVPIVIFLLMQIRVRSFWDVNNAVVGLLYSLITAAVFQVFIKWLIGGLRPHFLEICKPDVGLARGAAAAGEGYNKAGFRELYYTREICTGDETQINDALESFPSGHTTAAFAGFVYLYLYLNAKLKVFANYHAPMWKLVVLYMPILTATLIGGALTVDKFHNWYDVFAGAVIGTAMAFSAYRMCYAAIWDWHFNHIPLNRTRPFTYVPGEAELADAVGTRKVGWGLSHGHGHHATSGFNGHYATNGVNGHYGGDGVDGMTRKPVGGHPRRGDEMV